MTKHHLQAAAIILALTATAGVAGAQSTGTTTGTMGSSSTMGSGSTSGTSANHMGSASPMPKKSSTTKKKPAPGTQTTASSSQKVKDTMKADNTTGPNGDGAGGH